MRAARSLKIRYLLSTVLDCGMVAYFAKDLIPHLRSSDPANLMVASATLTAFAHYVTSDASSYLRFKKVCDLEWTMVNTPAEEKKTKIATAPDAVPQVS